MKDWVRSDLTFGVKEEQGITGEKEGFKWLNFVYSPHHVRRILLLQYETVSTERCFGGDWCLQLQGFMGP